jgi:hypothetical protein
MVDKMLAFMMALSALGHLPTGADGKCGDIVKAGSDADSEKAVKAFTEFTHGKIRDYTVSVENCGRVRWYFFVVMRGENVGRHWLMEYDTATGRSEITEGG